MSGGHPSTGGRKPGRRVKERSEDNPFDVTNSLCDGLASVFKRKRRLEVDLSNLLRQF
jgi:hypothetical protein